MDKSILKKLFFVLMLIAILIFFIWSKLFLVSFGLVLIWGSFATKNISGFFSKKMPKNIFNFIKYIYFILLPIGFAIFIRTLFLDIYFVPSSSMERTLFPDDYVLINKVSYGTKVPKRIQDIPVIGGLFKEEGPLLKFDLYSALKGFKSFNREDIVVLKSTVENDIYLIKRIIGMPSDTLEIIDAKVYINNNSLKDKGSYCFSYIDKTQKGILRFKTYSNKEFENLEDKYKRHLDKNIKNPESKWYTLFPSHYANEKDWSKDNYGKLIIPQKGKTINLTGENFAIYKSILQNFENQSFEVLEDESKMYTFKNNYYFMMGDNRHGSIDSRMFGFIPESYIQGKMIKVFSKKRFLN